jgi:hypothetical protein
VYRMRDFMKPDSLGKFPRAGPKAVLCAEFAGQQVYYGLRERGAS